MNEHSTYEPAGGDGLLMVIAIAVILVVIAGRGFISRHGQRERCHRSLPHTSDHAISPAVSTSC